MTNRERLEEAMRQIEAAAGSLSTRRARLRRLAVSTCATTGPSTRPP